MLDFQCVFERKREEVGERALSNASFVKTYSCILFKKGPLAVPYSSVCKQSCTSVMIRSNETLGLSRNYYLFCIVSSLSFFHLFG